jgi:hypothetical protein
LYGYKIARWCYDGGPAFYAQGEVVERWKEWESEREWVDINELSDGRATRRGKNISFAYVVKEEELKN